ncbi:MAG TPA: hypothetical protein VMB80_06420 [Candidatus Acidoferrum sp.]|nr:hypothetical protein [Candidatus Acidoferrum sp.]
MKTRVPESCSAVLLCAALSVSVNSVFGQGNGALLLTTITNPTPASGDIFGESVAAVGSDRVLIGSEVAAEAYLFSLDGTLLTTFTNPEVPGGGGFGYSLAAVGSDRVLIGNYNYFEGVTQVGRAYLFSTNGALLTTFTNPSPAAVQGFGWSVAGLGSDRVLIGGPADGNKGAPYRAAAYLFRTNGTLLATLTNPVPAYDGGFGLAVVAVGSDRVLVGAPYDNRGASFAGAAYLFSTNGNVITTFTNPIPAFNDNFGTALAAVGNNRLLISAIDYGNAKGNGGSAYLFDINGALLTSITNPTPAAYEYFGWSVAAVGSSRLLIGAFQDGTSPLQAGSAYLFSTNGTLLNTFTNPTPAPYGFFGYSVAAIGTDRVIIGGLRDDTGATDAGAAYLYGLPYPTLRISRNVGTASLSWVTAESGLILQQTDLLGTPVAWSDATNAVSVNGTTNVVQTTTTSGPTSRFYRLRRP